MTKRLYKSKNNRVFAGVIGGLEGYTGVDAVVLRLLALLIFIVTGFVPLALVYLIAIFLVPDEPSESNAAPL